jgi:hypothetical protein
MKSVGEMRATYKVLVGKPEGKRLVSRPRCRWKDNTKIDLIETGCKGMHRIQLAQEREIY